jgi:membrane protease YdiL (CAAX protease family)
MNSSHHARNTILTYLVITFAGSAIFWYIMIRAGSIHPGGVDLTFALMWVPGLAGLFTTFLFNHNLRGMGWRPGKARYLLFAYALPIAYGLLVYGSAWLTGLVGFQPNLPFKAPLPGYIVVAATVIFLFLALPAALGEEIGWRGLLVPQLARLTSFPKVALISGLIWLLWHIPLILFADYNSGAPAWYALACFSVEIMGMSFVITWLRLKSGSLWPAAVLHASHNLFIQSIFDRLVLRSSVSLYITTEFGIGLALVLLALGIFFWQWARKNPGELSYERSAS